MNYAQSLSTAFCTCGKEVRPEQLNEAGKCMECRIDDQIKLDAEHAGDFQSLSHEALVSRVVSAAKTKAHTMHSTTYSLSSVITESMRHAEKRVGEQAFRGRPAPKMRAESLLTDREPIYSAERDARPAESL